MNPLSFGKLEKKYPQTPQAYYDLIKQALFEVQDLRYAIEYESDGMETAMGFIGQLESHLQNMANAMKEGCYQFGNEDLPFMGIAKKNHLQALPFRVLLQDINHVHKNGLDTRDD